MTKGLKAVVLGTLLATTQLSAELTKNSPEVVAKCDKNNNHKIDTRLDIKKGLSSKKIVIAENKCRREYEIQKGKDEIQKGKDEIQKGKERIKILESQILE